ncbi:MAG: sulfotransferase family 2 domain-containing protein [Porticoccaceae bacterium]
MFFPNKYLLIHIPKTGGSSLEHAIVKSYLPEVDDSQLDDEAYRQFTVHGHFADKIKGQGGHTHSFISEYDQFLNIDDYYKFVVLRNPFDQVISLYNQLRKQVPIPSLEHFILGDENLTIKNVSHYIDQYKFTHVDDELRVDKVFVFDRYHEAQDFVEEKFHLKLDRAKRLWKTEYTGEQLSTEARDQFESIYHQSIELYHRYL